MSRTACYKAFVLILFLGFDLSPVGATLLKPSQNGEEREILVINSKRRLYYSIRKEGLVYSVSGPARLEFISRYPVVNKKKKAHAFQYVIIMDETDTIKVRHRYKIQKSIRSIQHPNHYYTYSGNYFVNLPEGQHTISLASPEKQKYPVLIRVLSKDFFPPSKDKKNLAPMVHQTAKHITVGSTELKYYKGSHVIPLQISVTGPGTLRIISRLEFEDWMGDQEIYRIRVMSASKVIGTFFFSTEKSEEALIREQPDRIPGKWRTCDISVPNGKNTYTIEILEKDRDVLMRFMAY